MTDGTTQPDHTEGWEVEFEDKKSGFLVYDKQSGSRWLDDEKIKDFITHQRQQAQAELREELVQQLKDARLPILGPDDVKGLTFNIALDHVWQIIKSSTVEK